jgi:hypothetical protein
VHLRAAMLLVVPQVGERALLASVWGWGSAALAQMFRPAVVAAGSAWIIRLGTEAADLRHPAALRKVY